MENTISRWEEKNIEYFQKFCAIKNEWQKFITGKKDTIDHALVSEEVFDSWNRCAMLGVDPLNIPHHQLLKGKDFNKLIQDNKSFIEISRPFMQNLYKFLKGSGFVVALYDGNGYFLEIIGDDDAVSHAKNGDLVVGALWTEASAGNNSAGTVITLKKPIQIFASEHYNRFFHHETDSSAPIFNPENELIGGICLTGRYFRVNPHTLGLVVAAAQAIENEMRTRKATHKLQIAYSYQKAVITSVPEALIAVGNDNKITLVNDNAKKILFPDLSEIEGKSLMAVFGKENGRFLTMINDNENITDNEVRIYTQHTDNDYTMTCNSILDEGGAVIGKIIILNEIKRAKRLVTKMMGAKAKLSFDDICGQNPRFLMIMDQARIISRNRSNVLLLGESGTGKDIFAQAIHNAGERRNGPYIAINCAAIPRDLIASELFGYSEGAYTGSRRGGNQGKFELADGGTIFLDEIAEVPLDLQAVLLRVIEDKCIVRIGGSRIRPVDVRIIAATNRDLMEEVRKGRFRKDLYYRLNVFTIQLLPLSERPDDIPLLTDYFIKKYAEILGKEVAGVNNDVIKIFQRYSWPGNIRELQNIVERMLNYASSQILTADLVPEELRQISENGQIEQQTLSSKDFERKMIEKMIEQHHNKALIARKMDISRPTLYRKLKEYKILS